RGKAVERCLVVPLSGKADGRAEPRQLDLIEELARGFENLDLGSGIFQVTDEQPAADQIAGEQYLFGLGHQLLPVFRVGLVDVDRDNSAARGVEIRLKQEARALVVDELVPGIEIVNER